MAMEGQVEDLLAFLKGMQAQIDQQYHTVKATLEANTSVLQEFFTWKPKVQADVEELQNNVCDLPSWTSSL